MSNECCGTCHFCLEKGHYVHDGAWKVTSLECHRNPPFKDGWPKVSSDDWCGAWIKLVEDDDEE